MPKIFNNKIKNYFRNVVDNSMDNKTEQTPEEQNSEMQQETAAPKAESRKDKKERIRVEELQQQVEALTTERDKAKENMLRTLAELENFRRRTTREKDDIIRYSNAKLLTQFLDIPDTLATAIVQGKRSNDYAAMLQGLELLNSKVEALLKAEGVEKMKTEVGDDFNVELMEAILMQPSKEVAEGKILTIVSGGYTYYDKVLRHAKVIISAGAPEEEQAKAAEAETEAKAE